MEEQLQHDVAVQMAAKLLDIIASCLREEEHRDALEEFYFVCHEGLGRYSAELRSNGP